jgi:hypothetical protein
MDDPRTAPKYYAKAGQFRTMQALLQRNRIGINWAPVPGGWTCLHHAAEYGELGVCEWLAAHGARNDLRLAVSDAKYPSMTAVDILQHVYPIRKIERHGASVDTAAGVAPAGMAVSAEQQRKCILLDTLLTAAQPGQLGRWHRQVRGYHCLPHAMVWTSCLGACCTHAAMPETQAMDNMRRRESRSAPAADGGMIVTVQGGDWGTVTLDMSRKYGHVRCAEHGKCTLFRWLHPWHGCTRRKYVSSIGLSLL